MTCSGTSRQGLFMGTPADQTTSVVCSLAQLLDMIFLNEIRQTTGNLIVYSDYVMLYCSNLYEVKKGCLQFEGVKNPLSSAIKKAITREELSRHCKDTGEAETIDN